MKRLLLVGCWNVLFWKVLAAGDPNKLVLVAPVPRLLNVVGATAFPKMLVLLAGAVFNGFVKMPAILTQISNNFNKQ